MVYMGNLNTNQYDRNSINNPYGRYGSKYSSQSINNPYSKYGRAYGSDSINNPYSKDNYHVYDDNGTLKLYYQDN